MYKRFFPVAAMVGIILASCSHSRQSYRSNFRWEPVGPIADPLINRLDSTFIEADFSQFSSDIDKLANADSIMRKAPATYYYWRMRDCLRRQELDSTIYWMNLALEHSNASRRPYERNRIRLFQSIMSTDKFKAYQHLDTALNYFKASADSFMAADCYVHL